MNNNLTDSIESAINLIEQDNKHLKKYSKIYPFTTENIAGYINEFDLKDKSLLTVGSSCDQAFNAILNGSKEISIIDTNPYVRYYYNLKKAALLNLGKEKYLEFLASDEALDKEIFHNIKSTLRSLDMDSYIFWDELLNNYSSSKVRSNLLYKCELNKDKLCNVNQYLQNEVAYDLLKNKIDTADLTFINDNILNFYSYAKYDNIWFSNVITNYKNSSKEKLLTRYIRFLNPKGQILLSYIYLANDKLNTNNFAHFLSNNPSYKVETNIFESVDNTLDNQNDLNDAIIKVRKK